MNRNLFIRMLNGTLFHASSYSKRGHSIYYNIIIFSRKLLIMKTLINTFSYANRKIDGSLHLDNIWHTKLYYHNNISDFYFGFHSLQKIFHLTPHTSIPFNKQTAQNYLIFHNPGFPAHRTSLQNNCIIIPKAQPSPRHVCLSSPDTLCFSNVQMHIGSPPTKARNNGQK